MWSNVAKKLSSTTSTRFPLNSHTVSRTCSFLGFSQDPILPHNVKFTPFELNFPSNKALPKMSELYEFTGRPTCTVLKKHVSSYGLCLRGYASVAEAAVEEGVSTGDEVQDLSDEIRKRERREDVLRWRRERLKVLGVGDGIYYRLKRRQIKIETEAWQKTAEEYQELIADMCEQKLAPNLPYMKSLFLGWFEPLCHRITAEQQLCERGTRKAAYASYFFQLPADKMAVITMHKLMGFLMKGEYHGSVRIVQAACKIGEAVEQEEAKVWGWILDLALLIQPTYALIHMAARSKMLK